MLTEGLAAVRLNRKWGYIDKDDKVLIDFKYFFASEFENGQAHVASRSNNYFYINKTGLRIRPKFRQEKDFLSCYGDLNLGKWGFMKDDGKVIALTYEETRNSSEGFAAARINGKWGYVNSMAEPISEFMFDQVSKFKEGFAAVKLNNRWGYLNTSGQLTIAMQFLDAGDFLGELSRVKFEDGRWAYIDKNAKTIWKSR